MFKMGLHDPFGHLKHKLWPKEGPKVKLAIWLPTTKSWESPWFLYVQVVCHIPLEIYRQRIQFCFKLHLNWKFAHKLWAPEVTGVPTLGILGLPFGSRKTKWHLGAGPVIRHKVYYNEEGGGFPQVLAVVSLVNLCLFVTHSCTKMFQLRTNQLVA
jgi:hypothetical protein